ncbi:MAG TPA: EF-hand domain-containing protein [Leptolyngbyaceae cyanobacterium M33_DOE_097]|uniref:Calcium-binding protein n=1 Tax=Oscillatoriales cyanobacterium SpSt-418 TaxID=2282169 RepID=A0A7C3PIU2_9CYAN|nr:EF-hand domain-containing protein [Leptolyngbyaceae cyanobacterium M33_DOE_097]
MTTEGSNFQISEDIKALLPEEKLSSIIATFNELDFNQNGKIELEEYLEYFLKREKNRRTKQFQNQDADHDGCINFEEFVAAVEPNFYILKKFRELDLDQNGLLSLEEAVNIANQLVLPVDAAQIEVIVRKVDRDGDGQITYYEYLGAIAHIGFQ